MPNVRWWKSVSACDIDQISHEERLHVEALERQLCSSLQDHELARKSYFREKALIPRNLICSVLWWLALAICTFAGLLIATGFLAE